MATTITQGIVTLNVSVVAAPSVSQLQQSGAIISVGGSTLTTGDYQYCGTLAAVEALLSSSGNYAELTNMATTFFAQGTGIGLYVLELGTQTTSDDAVAALQAWITDNPGIFYGYLTPADWDSTQDEVGSVTITDGGSGYTTAPTVTFTAPTSGTTATGTATIQNGVVISVTITDPGSGYTAAPTVTFSAPTSGTTATATAVLASAFNILAGNYTNNTARTYFFGTTSSSTITNYSPYKSLCLTAPSPTAPSTEFTAAAPFYQWIVNNPSATSPLSPFGYRFAYGVTPWPATGYTTEINTILTAYGNLYTTGVAGGLASYNILQKGMFMSGDQMMSWYGLDWFQIQAAIQLTNAIINGANSNPPLYYNQHGINTLQALAQEIVDTGITFGCLLSGDVTATSFYTYSQQNPSDYKAGIYNGLLATVTEINGFLSMVFNITALQFAA